MNRYVKIGTVLTLLVCFHLFGGRLFHRHAHACGGGASFVSNGVFITPSFTNFAVVDPYVAVAPSVVVSNSAFVSPFVVATPNVVVNSAGQRVVVRRNGTVVVRHGR